MGGLAVLRTADALGDLADALTSDPEWLHGIWIESDGRGPLGWDAGNTVARLALVPSLGIRTVRRTDDWVVCRADVAGHAALVDLLMYLSARGSARVAGRFIPVFRADESAADHKAAWRTLAHRYPGAVLPFIVQDARGRLRYEDPEGLAA